MNDKKLLLDKWDKGYELSKLPDQLVERVVELTPLEIWLLTQFTMKLKEAEIAEHNLKEWMDVLAQKYQFQGQRDRALAMPPFIKIFRIGALKGIKVI